MTAGSARFAIWRFGVPALMLAAGVAVTAQRPLDGVIDIHVHSAPDNVERSIDSIDVAKLARDRGMRAIVLKSHYEPPATMAFIGRNAVAVEHMTQVTGGYGRLVWMSTFDAENQVRVSNDNRPFVRVAKDGQLLQ